MSAVIVRSEGQTGSAAQDRDTVVTVSGLTRRYGSFVAVEDLDLQITRGEVFALLGPNGAGKTTTMEILEGFRHRDAGEVEVLGVDPAHAGRRWRDRVGIVSQSTGAFDELSVREIVAHYAGLYSAPLPVDDVIELVGLTSKAGARGLQLSGGQKRRLDVALGIIGDPELVFLDEPTTGLDPVARRQAWDLVRGLTERGKTVILTTHYLDEAEALADRVGVIVRGRLREIGTPQTIGGRADATARISFLLADVSADSLPVFSGDATTTVRTDEAGAHYCDVRTVEPAAALRVLLAWADQRGLAELPQLTVTRPTLEDVYLRMIADTPPAESDPSTAPEETS